MISTLVRVVLVQQEYGIYTRSCSSALRGACSSCVLVWLSGQRADDALPSLVARPHAVVYLGCWYSSMVSLLAFARMLLRTWGGGTAVCYLYSLLLCRPNGMLLCT